MMLLTFNKAFKKYLKLLKFQFGFEKYNIIISIIYIIYIIYVDLAESSNIWPELEK